MNWDDCRFFLAAAEAGSLLRASRRLGTNQPTVGRHIAALERDLGVHLFHRHARGLTLTEAGERILQSIQAMNEAASAVNRAVQGKDSSLSGTVRISAPESIGVMVVAPGLQRLHALYPDIETVLHLTAATADLARGEADIALRMFRPSAGDLVARHVGKMGFGLYASSSYLTHAPPLNGPGDLAAHTLLGYGEELDHLSYNRWLLEVNHGRAPLLRCTSSMARAQAAVGGLGVALLPCEVGDPWPGLIRVLPETALPGSDIWLVMHKDVRYVSRIRVAMDFLASLFA